MKQKLRVSSCALLMILLRACSCLGVTFPSKDGKTNLPLSQIPDIIRHVTGKTSGDLRFEKNSLFLLDLQYKFDESASKNSLKGSMYSFTSGGKSNLLASYTDSRNGYGNHHVMGYQKASAVIPSMPDSSDRRKLLLNFYDDYDMMWQNAVYANAASDNDSLISLQHDSGRYRFGGLGSPYGFLVDAKAGVRVKGYDGYTNEVVVAYSNRTAVYYKVIQFSHTGSTAKDARFSVNTLTTQEAGRYDYSGYSQYAARYQNLDGVSCTYSV